MILSDVLRTLTYGFLDDSSLSLGSFVVLSDTL